MHEASFEITIPQGQKDRLDKALALLTPEEFALSRMRLKELIQSGQVFQEGEIINDPKRKVSAGEVYHILLPKPEPYDLIAEAIPLDVVYEDENLIVVNKPAGMVVHPAKTVRTGTLVNALLHHAGASLSGIGGVERPGIVHRIDKDTSGLLVVAKNDRSHEGLSAQFRDHSIERLYTAFTYGQIRANDPRILGLEGVSAQGERLRIDLPIGRHKTDRLRMAIRDNGKHAVTHIKTEGNDKDALITKITCQLETGRTHQIRVHLNHIGHALLGDPIYGKGARQLPKIAPNTLCETIAALHGQALHARSLGFLHPITGDRLHFEAPLPADMQTLENLIKDK